MVHEWICKPRVHALKRGNVPTFEVFGVTKAECERGSNTSAFPGLLTRLKHRGSRVSLSAGWLWVWDQQMVQNGLPPTATGGWMSVPSQRLPSCCLWEVCVSLPLLLGTLVPPQRSTTREAHLCSRSLIQLFLAAGRQQEARAHVTFVNTKFYFQYCPRRCYLSSSLKV